jgi:hypothetical protein
MAVTGLLRRPLLGRSEDAVASTVGTIMALLVFLTFLSLITNQYVPVWMKDSEAAHMSEALGQFGTFKSGLDLQILVAEASVRNGDPYVPVTTFTSVKVGVDGVPIFTAPTIGSFRADQSGSAWNVSFAYALGGVNTLVPTWNCNCGGNVRLQVFNRFFIPQTLAYENGAVVRSQSDGQVVKGQPAFHVSRIPDTSVTIDYRLIEIFADGRSDVTGFSAEGLEATLIGLDFQEYTDIQTAIDINATTQFGPAWYRFFNDTLASARAYNLTMDYYDTYPAESDLIADYAPDGTPLQLTANNPYFRVQSLWDPAKRYYTFTLQLKREAPGDSIVVEPVTAFRLTHGRVDVKIGAL